MLKKFQGSVQRSVVKGLSSSEKEPYFLKISKWQHKHVRQYKRGTLALNNAAKTYSYWLKISENIVTKHVF